MRRTLSVLVAALVAALGSNIVGEYELRGYVPFLAGLLVGFVVGEVAVAVHGRRDAAVGAAAAVVAGAGLAWGAWLSTSEGVEPWPALAWAGIAVAAGTAGARGGLGAIRSSAGPAARSQRREPPRTPRS